MRGEWKAMPKRNVRKTARTNNMKTLKSGLVRKPATAVTKIKAKAKTRKIGVGRPKRKTN